MADHEIGDERDYELVEVRTKWLRRPRWDCVETVRRDMEVIEAKRLGWSYRRRDDAARHVLDLVEFEKVVRRGDRGQLEREGGL